MTLPAIDIDGTAGVAGSPWPCSLGARNYLIDLSRDAGFVERTIPLLRNQADTSTTQMESESSLNPEDLVRRAVETWHLGAGQVYRDRRESQPQRFYSSEGFDPWTKWQLTLQQATKSIRTLTTNVYHGGLAVANSRLYVADGQTIYYTTSDPSGSVSWTTVTGNPAADVESICTDGAYVYIAYGSNGVYYSATNSSTMTQLFTGTVRHVWFLKDRLITYNGGAVITNPTDFTTPPNALPTALWTHPSGSWTFSSATEGIGHIYFSGYPNPGVDRSVIFKTAVKPDGTALEIPTVAASLPDGEIVETMCGYLGYVLLGTSSPAGDGRGGVRLCQARDDGNLILGPRIEIGDYVFAFEPQGNYVWFTWMVDSTRSGIGRLDLTRFTDDLVPAYAQDLMYTGTGFGHVSGIVTYLDTLVFRVNNDFLVCRDDTALVSTATMNLGKFAYGIADDKVGMFLDVQMEGLGSVEVFVSVDGGTSTSYGTLTATGSVQLDGLTGKEFEIVLTATPNVGSPNTSPKIRRVTMRSFVAAERTREYVVPLIIRPKVITHAGRERFYATRDEVDAIAAMVGTVVVWKLGTKVEYVQVKDYEWRPDYYDPETAQFGGTCIVRLQRLTDE